MTRWLTTIVITAIMLALPLAIQSGAAQEDTTLRVSHDEAVGAFLTDAEGMTLYLFTRDTTPGESTCYDGCAEAWPPLPPDKATALPAGVPGELTVIERDDDTQMVAYNDIPLYYYTPDEAPGDITGQDAGGVWFIVPPGAELGPYGPAPEEGTPVPSATLKIGFTEELGPFLVDADGMTVYLFTRDTTAGESACYDGCAEAWPPVPAAAELHLPPGIQGTLASFEREDGASQLTYNDIPLYYYAEDEAAGDVNGQGAGDVWYVVPPGMELGDEPHVGEAHEMGGDAEMATPSS